jgi:dCTP deaminase
VRIGGGGICAPLAFARHSAKPGPSAQPTATIGSSARRGEAGASWLRLSPCTAPCPGPPRAASPSPQPQRTYGDPRTMILTGEEIRCHLGKRILIEPFDPARLNPNSYNVSLHDELLTYADEELDMQRLPRVERLRIPPQGLLIQPGRLYLGRTVEYTETHGFVPMLEGRSSIGRLGLFIHVTAGFGDTGFCGYWTLEIAAIQPIRIYAGVQIGQLYYHQVVGDVRPYRSDKYQNNRDIQPSLLYKDFTRQQEFFDRP